MTLWFREVETPWGPYRIVSNGTAVVATALPGEDRGRLEADLRKRYGAGPLVEGDDPVLSQAVQQVQEYLHGKRNHFTLPLDPAGTEFQKAVWTALQDIPFGETRSYADIAAALGRPGAARAVGQANRRNRIPLVVPCHRVVAADGSLGGYMGQWNEEGGLKAQLLAHEGRFAR